MKADELVPICGLFLSLAAPGLAQTTFTKITDGDIVNDAGTFTSCVWGDFNKDGFLDCFVCAYKGTNILYLNNRDGTFTKITQGPPFQDATTHMTASAADYRNDGSLGLLVASGAAASVAQTDFLYQSQGDGTFTRVTTGSPANDLGQSWTANWVDYDRDGKLDALRGRRWDTVIDPSGYLPRVVRQRYLRHAMARREDGDDHSLISL